MKNKKLLMPLAGVAALGAVSPIVVMATSCGEKADSSITKITATATRTEVYIGETVYKTDIQVVATYTSGVEKDLDPSEWSCGDLGDNGYTFHKDETKAFDIAYHGHHTSVTFKATAYGYLTFERLITPNLCVGDGFATSETLHIYGASVESEAKEIDLDLVDITVTTGDDFVSYNSETKRLTALAKGSATLTAHYKDLPAATTEYDTTLTVTVTEDSITSATKDTWTGNAWIQISKPSETTTKFVKVPDYVKIGEEDVKVVEIRKATSGVDSTVESIYIPETITNIQEKMFADNNALRNVYFGGTKRQWNRISAGDNWAGAGCIGGYCLGEEDWTEGNNFVYFTNCQGSTYDSTAKTYTSESAVGGVVAATYKVEFDLAWAAADGQTLTDYKTLKIINGARFPIGSMTIDSVYLDGVALTQGTGSDADYDTTGDRYLQTLTFTNTASHGVNLFKQYSRIIVTFTTPGTSAGAVTAELSK